mmetsp:Transcript_16452/g.28194  ORF Transcript_16452/g.28194 Transcript_16452/m.28194 type:complete len:367 (-) Transcript_16452:357-1457(-)
MLKLCMATGSALGHALTRGYTFRALSHAGSALSRDYAVQALVYDEPGEPDLVLRLQEMAVQPPGPGQISVRMLQAPINPSDINTCQGTYPLRPALPCAVPGHEGVGRVIGAGSEVQLQVGDLVVPLTPCQGTWRQAGTFAAAAWHALPKETPVDAAATLCINPRTALALLDQFVDLQPGEVVLQNGGNSSVGQLVIQLARARGLKTVSVIRHRPDWDATVAHLQHLGADLVTTSERLKADLKAAAIGPPPRLGLNCVGGEAALAVCKALAEGGTLVTYGGMSKQPLTIPTSLLIFKDITFKGFWLSGRYAKNMTPQQRGQVLDTLAEYARQGVITTRTVKFPLAEWRKALAHQQAGGTGKAVLDMA